MTFEKLLYWLLVLISVATLISGIVQIFAPGFILGMISGEITPATRQCFATIGMFMALFGGMLFKSGVFFHGKLGFHLFKKGSAKLIIGDHPRVAPLKDLEISPDPIFSAFLPQANGVLDDHSESWFLSEPTLPAKVPEGMEAVVNLGQGQEWLAPPVPVSEDAAAAAELIRR